MSISAIETNTDPLMPVWAEVDGLRLFARISARPASPVLLPVVLVHGLSVSSRYMVPTARQLVPHRAVYAPDLPGFGKSEKPSAPLDIPALADALLAWMDAFGLQRAVMLGNSMGCQIIAELALRAPTRLAAAVLVGPTMDRKALSMLGQAWRLLRDGPHEPLSSILTQGSDYVRFGFRRTLRTLRYALADRIEQKLPHMRMPTLVIRGEHDPIAPQRWAEELERLLPHGELLVIPNAPHALNYVTPGPLVRATLAFLANHPEIEHEVHW